MEWEHHPSHFWLVLLTALSASALAYVTNVAAGRHRDARLVLVSLAFLASAGFLGLHALATPGVLLPTQHRVPIATPVGLVLASVFAVASVSPLAGPRSGATLRAGPCSAGLLVLMACGRRSRWPTCRRSTGPPPQRRPSGPSSLLAVGSVVLYVIARCATSTCIGGAAASSRSRSRSRSCCSPRRWSPSSLSRNWHLSWWEWHLLMLAAFVRHRPRRAVRVPAQRVARRHVRRAVHRGDPRAGRSLARRRDRRGRRCRGARRIDRSVLAELRRDGATDAESPSRRGRPGAPPPRPAVPAVPARGHVATRLRREPSAGAPGRRGA